MVVSIPPDIWKSVAQFISIYDLCDMFSINSTFFQLAMDARYHDVTLSTKDDAIAEYMARLRDPAVAHRVRELYVDLVTEDNKHECEGNGQEGTPGTSLGKIIQAMTHTVTCFTNVSAFRIQLEHLPGEEHLLPFLTTSWKSFDPTLREITVSVQLRHLPTLLSATGACMGLRSLDVYIRRPDWIHLGKMPTPQDEERSVALVNSLAQFVRKVAPTLRSLLLHSWWSDFELSPLFHQLGNIPNLEQLSIFITYRNTTVPRIVDLRDFIHFLRNHAATLRHIHWTGTCPLQHLVDEETFDTTHEHDKHLLQSWALDWLSINSLDEAFSNLLSLQMPVRSNLALTLPIIKLSVNTLTSLRLHLSFMTYDEVDTLGQLFATRQTGHLRELNLKVMNLSPEVVVLLARVFPRLEQLGIKYFFMTSQKGVKEIGPRNKEQELRTARRFATAMRKCDLRDWPLLDIKIKKHRPYDVKISKKLMVLLAECVSSVELFDGVDKAYYIEETHPMVAASVIMHLSDLSDDSDESS